VARPILLSTEHRMRRVDQLHFSVLISDALTSDLCGIRAALRVVESNLLY
jgi:hypothetical protein